MPKKLDCRLKINKSKKSCAKNKSSKKKNCPKGSRRNPKTGRCVKSKSVKSRKPAKSKKSVKSKKSSKSRKSVKSKKSAKPKKSTKSKKSVKSKKSSKSKKSVKSKKSSKSRKPTGRKQLKTKLSSHVKDKHHAWETYGPLTKEEMKKYKKKATKDIFIAYRAQSKKIPKGETYYMRNNKILVGWHGTTNPPQGM